MDRESFWNIMDAVALAAARRQPTDDQCSALTDVLQAALQDLSPGQLEQFQDHLQLTVGEAYTSEMFAAHYIVNGGGSLDGFLYFRAWLVAQGQRTYQAALEDPDSLTEVCSAEGCVADFECEEILLVARGLYEDQTGQEMSWRADPGDLGQEMRGAAWEEEADLHRLLPRLAAIHLS